MLQLAVPQAEHWVAVKPKACFSNIVKHTSRFKNWLQKLIPSVEKWRELMKEVKEMEQLTYNIRGNPGMGRTLWTKWESYTKSRGEMTLHYDLAPQLNIEKTTI